MAIDNRIMSLGITFDGVTTWHDDLWIQARGMKVTSTLMSDCEITIIGLSSDARNRILKYTTPKATDRKRVKVEFLVGRESYGLSTYYKGDVFRSTALPKPNLGLRLRCIIGQQNKDKAVSHTGDELTKLSDIAAWVAQDAGYSLSFEIADKNIRSYSFTGSVTQELKELQNLSQSDVYVDNDTLYIKPSNVGAKGKTLFNVSNAEGNLIMSTSTEAGAKIKMIFHPLVTIGSLVNLKSNLNPQLDGTYTIFKCSYDITNRDQAFYNEVEGALVQ